MPGPQARMAVRLTGGCRVNAIIGLFSLQLYHTCGEGRRGKNCFLVVDSLVAGAKYKKLGAVRCRGRLEGHQVLFPFVLTCYPAGLPCVCSYAQRVDSHESNPGFYLHSSARAPPSRCHTQHNETEL
jgi:hypothetical protein